MAAGENEDPNPTGGSGPRPGQVPAALAANIPVPALVPERRAGPGAHLSQGQASAVTSHCPSGPSWARLLAYSAWEALGRQKQGPEGLCRLGSRLLHSWALLCKTSNQRDWMSQGSMLAVVVALLGGRGEDVFPQALI